MAGFDDLMAAVGRLVADAEALAALAARLRADAEGIDVPAAIAAALDPAVAELGLDLDALSDDERRTAAGFARAFLRQALDLAEHPERPPGWVHEDPGVLLTLGRASAVIASVIASIAPQLDGLEAALAAEGAAICDVGSGVGALSIALARTWPAARVVGLEPWAPSRRLAAEEIAAAGLGDRIEIRDHGVEDLGDRDAFDAVWLAGPFLPEPVLPAALERSLAALRPGGWLLFGAFAGPPDPLARRVMELRVVRAGGSPLPPEAAVARLQAAGYAEVRPIERTWQAPVDFVVGRRPG